MPTFTHGSKAKVYANGYDLTSFFKSADHEGTADTAETTALGNTSKTYIGGLKEGSFEAEGMYDGSAQAVDQVLAAALGVDFSRIVYLPQGDALGNFGYGYEGQETKYALSSPVDDVTSVQMALQSSKGAERVIALAAKGAIAAGTQTGAAQDNGASSAAGAAAYLHVFSLGGGTVDVKVQHSTDNTTWVDLITFAQVAPGGTPAAQRLSVAGTVNRYLRAVVTVATGPANVFVGATRLPNNL